VTATGLVFEYFDAGILKRQIDFSMQRQRRGPVIEK
jgi:hypothetical protein